MLAIRSMNFSSCGLNGQPPNRLVTLSTPTTWLDVPIGADTNGTPAKPNPVSCERTRYTSELAMLMCLRLREQNPAAFDALSNAPATTDILQAST